MNDTITRQPTPRDPLVGKLWRILYWGAAAALVALPALAMQFTDEVDWGPEDFTFAIILFALVGGALELTVRASRNWLFRAGMALTIGMSFVTIWSNLAVGIIGNEDNPANLVFFAGIALILLGGAVMRFRPQAMAVLTAVQALPFAWFMLDERAELIRPLLAGFAVLWLVAAALFWKAERR